MNFEPQAIFMTPNHHYVRVKIAIYSSYVRIDWSIDGLERTGGAI